MDDAKPDFLPAEFTVWVDAHHDLLVRVVAILARTGTWPLLADLTRDSVRIGRPTSVEAIFFDMPPPLRFRTGHPERAVVSLFGLRLVHGGEPLLAGFYSTLALARDRYKADGDPTISSNDVGQIAVLSKAHPSALIEIVEREAPFLGSSTPQTSAEGWVREVSTSVVPYWGAETIDDFLRIRAGELRGSPTSHWPAPVHEASGPPSVDGANPGEPSVFISHASEDKADVARPIADGLEAAGWTVWLDEYELTVGDSLFQRINDGLAESRCGVVILSRSFFAKQWPTRELDALAAKESSSGAKVILPVWHGIDEQYLAREAPMLASRLGVSTDHGIAPVVDALTRALTKEISRETQDGDSVPLLRAVPDGEPLPPATAEPEHAGAQAGEPVLVLAPPSRHRLNEPHRLTAPPQVIWAQSALVDVENVGTAIAFIRSGGADAIGATPPTVKPPMAIAPGATRPVELIVSPVSATGSIAAGQLFRFWLDYGSGKGAHRRMWAIAQYNGGGGWTNVGLENRPLE